VQFIAQPGRSCCTSAASWAGAEPATPNSHVATDCPPSTSSTLSAPSGAAAPVASRNYWRPAIGAHWSSLPPMGSSRSLSRASAQASTATRSNSQPRSPYPPFVLRSTSLQLSKRSCSAAFHRTIFWFTKASLVKQREMGKKLTGKALAQFEAERDMWQEVLEGVREIKAGGRGQTLQSGAEVSRGSRAPEERALPSTGCSSPWRFEGHPGAVGAGSARALGRGTDPPEDRRASS